MRTIRNNHNICQLSLQLVLVCKKRQKFFNADNLKLFINAFDIVSKKYDVQLDRVNQDSDHLHCLISYNISSDLTKFIGSLKSCSSRLLKAKVPSFAWSNGFAIFSVGSANEQQIMDYIDEQDKPEHQLKYKK